MRLSSQAAPTVSDALEEGRLRLSEAGIEAPRRDAALLLAEATGQERSRLTAYLERRLTAAERSRYDGFVHRRAGREPVSRILGRREFWSLDFALAPETLDPRPETETLVEAVLARVTERQAPLEILDLGCGSGCILLALLTELPQARGLGIDCQPGAVQTARRNAEALGLGRRASFEVDDWGRTLAGKWQVIVSNPPYIVEGEIKDLAPEVANHDPHLALSGGADGLESYAVLLPQAARLLAPGGWLALEIGCDQFDAVRSLAEQSCFNVEDPVRDLAGLARCLVATPVSRG